MTQFDHRRLKFGFTTHAIPEQAMAKIAPCTHKPRAGDIVAAEVVSLGKHNTLEDCQGVVQHIFPGDWLVGAFGNRYATDQYEGYVPQESQEEFDLLSVGGVCGLVTSQHASMLPPTRLRLLGALCDHQGKALNLSQYRLPSRHSSSTCELILVVGASMNSGKTTTVGTLVRALSNAGLRVCAAKVTGTAAGKDGRYFASCGAQRVLDFTDVGHPSTYMLSLHELLETFCTLVAHLQDLQPDYIVIEVADGIFQRETRMLLDSMRFRSRINHVFFAANDSLSAECGARVLRELNMPLRAISGMVTQSPLAMREAEEATGLPCLSIARMLSGELPPLLGLVVPQPLLMRWAQQAVPA
jgi:hypothetical protein